MAYKSYFPSALGLITLTSNGKELTGLYFEGQKFAPNFKEHLEAPLEIFTKTKVYLVEYFNGNKPSFSLPLKPQGTDFQKLVWSSLITIPYGTTTTYGEIARQVALKLGKSKMSAQAVGSAIAHNPICIVIPCDRVLGQKQKMVGFVAGIERKEWLLRHEKTSIIV